jgi:hypothetical protein
VGGLVALILWLLAERPRLAKPARWVLSPILLGFSFISAIDPGGLVIYVTPILVPLLWWMALQSGVVARAIWALVAGFLAVEAMALLTYGTSNATMAPVLLLIGGSVTAIVIRAPRWRKLRRTNSLRF